MLAATVIALAAPVAASVDVQPGAYNGSVTVHANQWERGSATGPGTGSAEPDMGSVLQENWEPVHECEAAGTDTVTCLITLHGPGSPGSVTPGRVEEAIRRIGLPALTAHVQPEPRTLVNADTIVYTTPAPFDTTVVILGETVRIHAIPATYTWHFGDGTTTTTSHPGAPWPHDTISHRYQHADDHVPLSVTVSYDVTYNTNGAPWQPLDSPIDTPGPTTTITVTEAHAVLVAP